ncbi:MAG: hypothetical protein RLZZ480_508 [Candidatus Parcubacteria bacterium]|jgi:CxxC-x17-CxxC domain-containing protein
MNNFKNSGPGGLRGRAEFIGGRPKSDGDYKPKKSFAGKGGFGGKGGFKGGDRGGSRGGFGGKGGDRGGFGGSRDGGRREVSMHKATCSNCGKACEVPFRPDGSKPVLCSECFGKTKSDDRNGVERRVRFSDDRPKRDFDAPRPERGPSPEIKALQAQIATLEANVNEILSILKSVPAKKAAKAEAVVAEEKAPKKAVAKKAPVKKVAANKVVAKKAVKKVAKK